MKKFTLISLTVGALILAQFAATAQNNGGRNMQKRDQGNTAGNNSNTYGNANTQYGNGQYNNNTTYQQNDRQDNQYSHGNQDEQYGRREDNEQHRRRGFNVFMSNRDHKDYRGYNDNARRRGCSRDDRQYRNDRY